MCMVEMEPLLSKPQRISERPLRNSNLRVYKGLQFIPLPTKDLIQLFVLLTVILQCETNKQVGRWVVPIFHVF